MKILIVDGLDRTAVEILRKGNDVDVRDLDGKGLLAAIPEYHALVVRSRTKVTKEVLSRATRLKVVGRAGVGVDNIDVDEATARKIVVVNAPTASTVSVAELAIGQMISLLRHLPEADRSVKAGKWEKSKLEGRERRRASARRGTPCTEDLRRGDRCLCDGTALRESPPRGAERRLHAAPGSVDRRGAVEGGRHCRRSGDEGPGGEAAGFHRESEGLRLMREGAGRPPEIQVVRPGVVANLGDDCDVLRETPSQRSDGPAKGLLERLVVACPQRLFEDLRARIGRGHCVPLPDSSA